jgi:hypothetical protein
MNVAARNAAHRCDGPFLAEKATRATRRATGTRDLSTASVDFQVRTGGKTMSAFHAWVAAVLIILVGLVTLAQLGIAVVPGLATALHSVEHWLGEPLFAW